MNGHSTRSPGQLSSKPLFVAVRLGEDGQPGFRSAIPQSSKAPRVFLKLVTVRNLKPSLGLNDPGGVSGRVDFDICDASLVFMLLKPDDGTVVVEAWASKKSSKAVEK